MNEWKESAKVKGKGQGKRNNEVALYFFVGVKKPNGIFFVYVDGWMAIMYVFRERRRIGSQKKTNGQLNKLNKQMGNFVELVTAKPLEKEFVLLLAFTVFLLGFETRERGKKRVNV